MRWHKHCTERYFRGVHLALNLVTSIAPRNTTAPFFWNLSTLNLSISYVVGRQLALATMTMPSPRELLKSWSVCYHFVLPTEHSNRLDFEWSLTFVSWNDYYKLDVLYLYYVFFNPKDSGLEQLEPYTSIVVLELFALLPTITTRPKV